MRILPQVTSPPTVPITHRHKPKRATGEYGYQTYRACLRWDFGFTCPFCLLHEADLLRVTSVDGTGLFSVEHVNPRSVKKRLINQYANCVYCCRFCNGARSNRPIDNGRARLLNPTQAAWADHFEHHDHHLLEKPGDPDAEYTRETYDINDKRKVTMRRHRSALYNDHLPLVLEAASRRISALLSLAQKLTHDPQALTDLVSAARSLHDARRRAIADLSGYLAVPSDAPSGCRCSKIDEHRLPDAIGRQTLDLAFDHLES